LDKGHRTFSYNATFLRAVNPGDELWRVLYSNAHGSLYVLALLYIPLAATQKALSETIIVFISYLYNTKRRNDQITLLKNKNAVKMIR
jgi:hypothetical protein